MLHLRSIWVHGIEGLVVDVEDLPWAELGRVVPWCLLDGYTLHVEVPTLRVDHLILFRAVRA